MNNGEALVLYALEDNIEFMFENTVTHEVSKLYLETAAFMDNPEGTYITHISATLLLKLIMKGDNKI